MSDLISRQGTLKRLCEKCTEGDESTGCSEWKCIEYQLIEDMPSAQPERRKGKWILSANEMFVHCSRCGCHWESGFVENCNMIFCPSCGSYNGGEQDE